MQAANAATLQTHNRADRRQAERAARQLQTRATRKPGRIGINNLEVAKHRAARLTAEERTRVLADARAGLQALIEGVATWEQWSKVAITVNVALAIERMAVVRGMQEHFAAADCALNAVFHRVDSGERGAAWGKRTTLYFDEIAALREAIELHTLQLNYLSYTEFIAAAELAERNVRAKGVIQISTPIDTHALAIQEILL